MVSRDIFSAFAAAMALVPIAATLAPTLAFAQDGRQAVFLLDGQVYVSQVKAQQDPAFTDGAIFVGNPDFAPIVVAVRSLELNGINAAIIAANNDTVALLFDGRQVNEWGQADFAANQARIELTIERLKSAQAEQQ